MSRAGEWYWWFAWRPIRAECGRWTWLHAVWRRKLYHNPDTGPSFTSFEHRIPRGWVV